MDPDKIFDEIIKLINEYHQREDISSESKQITLEVIVGYSMTKLYPKKNDGELAFDRLKAKYAKFLDEELQLKN